MELIVVCSFKSALSSQAFSIISCKEFIHLLFQICLHLLFIIGKPTQMNNTDSESEKHIVVFLKLLKKSIPTIPVIRIDERFTSKMAFQTMIDSGLKKKQRRNKGLVDEISATIILQSYLYSKH